MLWQFAVIAQIIPSSLTALWARKVSLVNKNTFFSTGFFSYLVVALLGITVGLYHNGYKIPALPNGNIYWLLLGIGVFIPISWLLQYKLISIVGAANGMIANTTNFVTTAFFGFIFLGEIITPLFFAGSLLMLTATYISFSIKADTKHKNTASIQTKFLLIFGASIALALGLLFEKQSIDLLGVWNYVFYGWSIQLVGATVIWFIYGRKEIKRVNTKVAKYGLSLGVLVAISGLLFVYALSMGTLSSTIMAVSAKIALTTVLAVILLKERNDIGKRALALMLSIAGMMMILW